MAKSKNVGEVKRGSKATQFGQPNGNPINKATQFGQPNGNKQCWAREDTPRYKLERMMRLTRDELRAVIKDEAAPMFEKKIAGFIIDGEWREIEGMINQVYGLPKMKVETPDIKIKPLVDLTKRKKNGTNNSSK